MKIRQLGAEFLHADRWTDMPKLIVAFHNFVNARKKSRSPGIDGNFSDSSVPWVCIPEDQQALRSFLVCN
jgi:hypothetical protein